VLWLLVFVFAGAFAWQVAKRVRLIAGAPNTFSVSDPAFRLSRFIGDVLLQRRTIGERRVAGVAHALVFWGFLAFAGYTITEFLRGLASSISRALRGSTPTRLCWRRLPAPSSPASCICSSGVWCSGPQPSALCVG